MGDIKLFHITSAQVEELAGQAYAVEKSLQTLIEQHLEALLGIRFLATEYSTGKTHGGRIDTLGIDENGFPVIIEYKRASNENVINQGLFYLNWLVDHQGEFELLVMKRYGNDAAEHIEWSNPRLLCIAGDFTRYDEHAVQQINRTIELIRYRQYGKELLLLELVNAVAAHATPVGPPHPLQKAGRRRSLKPSNKQLLIFRTCTTTLKVSLLHSATMFRRRPSNTISHISAFRTSRVLRCITGTTSY